MAIIKYPLATEKVIRKLESENSLQFVVDLKANKQMIKKAIETQFKAKIETVNTYISITGEKRAIVKFAKETPAIDIATNLGLM